ncbi:epoxide hydrolase family protein [Janthinobacterium agaricidamnosum]|uniref:Tat (Twin-arginine translocation) pathway signal sequence domain protein n=1 Tax=Janthinobacterium agaricidamnosum NBRC 102515 = DSM 9628 TaxID=1349767 RepID=W0V2S7_9BURK|nr:epoxide hydrolase family protein [Janthinobacterium agaricidamnosum]CDG81567.1 tat (twin-arginine translocation) pathway signal sequence domain protein [Janthinobacterium agaricidamnosum NBRC 102515 = DSM 9628]
MPDHTPDSLSRRRFVGVAAATAAAGTFVQFASAAGLPALTVVASAAGGDPAAIRPLRVHVPDAELVELRRRIKASRWPERETVADGTQGVPLATMQTLARHWAGAYDWRKCEARLNALPQFLTEIDGLDIHFMHIRSQHENALPLIITHGWPGSFIELLKIIDPLVNPTAHGGSAADAFHLVIPSLPGYGFSGKPGTSGWGPERTASAWLILMKRLGYAQFVAQGGDLGAVVCNVMARQAPPELLGIHVNFPGTVPLDIIKAIQAGQPAPASLSAEERRAYQQLTLSFTKRRAYALEQGTRPQTLYGLADSPIALASWMIDHGDGFDQPAAALTSAVYGRPINGHSAGDLTLDDLLDDITLYWLTNTGVSAARFYWESHFNFYGAADVAVPAAVSVFPGEIYQAPRSWAQSAYRNLVYYNQVDKGGHFAAWEQAALFSEEVRAGFRPMRK